jgi:hypothetical protein
MSVSTLQSAKREYEDICEVLFQSWLANRIPTENLWSGFSVDHVPEPYLDFSADDRPLIWVTHNPGRGEPFQLRSATNSETSPIRTDQSYSENAKRLADWYAGRGSLKISAAARTRVSGMQALARQLGFGGLRQIELFPLHSKGRPPDEFLFGNPKLAEPLRSYGSRARDLIAASPIVIALCGGAPHKSAAAVQSWGTVLGMELDKAQLVSLSENRTSPTVGMFVNRSGPRTGVLFCRQGANGLPARNRMPLVVEVIRTALRG